MFTLKYVSTNNAKMGNIPSVSFPPIVTCSNCEECSKKCYAKRMASFHKSVGVAWKRNLDTWKTNPTAIINEINFVAFQSRYFRYFVGGDIPTPLFFSYMVEIAINNPHCTFLAFTKKYEVVNNFLKRTAGNELPQNLKVIFSKWGDKEIDNPYNLPTSNVIFRKQETPVDKMVCGGNCAKCLCQGIGCWNLKNGEEILFYEH